MGTGVVGHSAKTYLHILHCLGCSSVRFPKAQPRVGNLRLTEDLSNSCEGEREKGEAGQVRKRLGENQSLVQNQPPLIPQAALGVC